VQNLEIPSSSTINPLKFIILRKDLLLIDTCLVEIFLKVYIWKGEWNLCVKSIRTHEEFNLASKNVFENEC
jgi:hypothetical protein